MVGLQGSDARGVKRNLAATIIRLSPDITLDQFDRVRTDALDIANTLALIGDDDSLDLHDLAIEAYDLCCELLIDYDGCNDRPFSKVNEVYIDFASGMVGGTCDGCDADDVADALERIARELRLMSDTPSYIDFDEGKISAGAALSTGLTVYTPDED
jgi:hypothetical protein